MSKKARIEQVAIVEIGTKVPIKPSWIQISGSDDSDPQVKKWAMDFGSRSVNFGCDLRNTCTSFSRHYEFSGRLSCYRCPHLRAGIDRATLLEYNKLVQEVKGVNFLHNSDVFIFKKMESGPEEVLTFPDDPKEVIINGGLEVGKKIVEKPFWKKSKAPPEKRDSKNEEARIEYELRFENSGKSKDLGVVSLEEAQTEAQLRSDSLQMIVALWRKASGSQEAEALKVFKPTSKKIEGRVSMGRKGWPPATYRVVIDDKEISLGEISSVAKAKTKFKNMAKGSKKAELFVTRKGKEKKIEEFFGHRPGKMQHSRLPYHELRGSQTIELGKISSPAASELAQEKADELGESFQLWKYVRSKDEWSCKGEFLPKKPSVSDFELEQGKEDKQDVPIQKEPIPEATEEKSIPTTTRETEAPQVTVQHAADSNGKTQSLSLKASSGGFDFVADILVKARQTASGNGGERKFYTIEGPMGASIIGGFLGAEEVTRVQVAIDELNQLFPGKIRLVQNDLTTAQKEDMINALIANN